MDVQAVSVHVKIHGFHVESMESVQNLNSCSTSKISSSMVKIPHGIHVEYMGDMC